MNTISLKNILWKVLRNPLASELTYEEAAEFAIEALRLLGAPLSFEDKVTNPPLTISNYKVALPSTLLKIRGARLIFNLDNYEQGAVPLRHATDIYHKVLECSADADTTADTTDMVGEYAYTTQKGIMYTSVPDGNVQIRYQQLMVDEDGYPLIPNNEKVIMGMEYYILHRYLEPLWMMGKITDKAFHYIEQKRHFYMGGAQTSMQLNGIDHLESVMNTINRLIINTQAYSNFYKGSGIKERLRQFN